MMESYAKLQEMSAFNKNRSTIGIYQELVDKFISTDSRLRHAIDEAYAEFQSLKKTDPDLLKLSEEDLIHTLQDGILNFYDKYSINPYVPLAADGPWIITSTGAVLYDCGGYGMLGMGHAPKNVLDVLHKPLVMANVMTPSFSQRRFIQALKKEVGQNHTQKSNVYAKYLCLNSGSETMSIVGRICDIHAKIQIEGNGPNKGKKIKLLSLSGSFHGRTEKPAQVSHSNREKYTQYLASFRSTEHLLNTPVNDLKALEETFKRADKDGVYIEAVFLEPILGEGDPGKAITPEFYALARKLTKDHQSFLVVDSIQAGFRGHGVLSVVDYPGFEKLQAPDFESYSKALNAGQYPLSVLALSEHASSIYKTGLYGNTMTSNPKALEVACEVLRGFTPALRKNISDRGDEFLHELRGLAKEFPTLIHDVQGTGLLFSIAVDKNHFEIVGKFGLEGFLRKAGLGVIHGGTNSLRFTPNFQVTSQEIKLVVSLLRDAFKNAPQLSIPLESRSGIR